MPLQGKIGWRSSAGATGSTGSTTTVSSLLLDSYSGAAAAYSLRKLRSSYTGSAIRVRRSSDNTELNIGFDSDGNLDTYALSAFVGSGNGFVTTWYDQSGNSRDAFQTSAINQPQIISSGSILLENGKPTVSFTTSHTLATNSLNLSFYDCTISYVSKNISRSAYACGIFGYGTNGQSSQIRYLGVVGNTLSFIYYGADFWSNFTGMGDTKLTLYSLNFQSNTVNFYKNNSTQTGSQFSLSNTSSSRFTINDIYGRGEMANINFSEGIFYTSGKSDVINDIRSNQNSYYSVYPNPTSVWNLLAAAYNADTKSLPSLKTSLVAAYNGESNTNDSFGTNNGTAVGGLTYTTGKIGNAFNLNGTNAYVSLPNDSLNFTDDFSASLWVYNRIGGSVTYFFVGDYKWVNGNLYGWYFYNWGGYVAIEIGDGTGQIAQYQASIGGFQNQWVHYVVTRKKGTATKIYLNGTEYSGYWASGNVTQNPVFAPNSPCQIGANGNNCIIDGVNFWSKTLTRSEVTELYNSGNGAQYIGDSFYKPSTNDALNTYNGTAQGGLTYGVGKVGTAFVGNGTNGYVSLPNNSFNFTGSMSINMWVNISSSTTGSTFMGNYYYVSGGRDYGWIFEHTSSGTLRFYMQTSSNSPVILSTSYSGKYNSWKMITVTKLQNSTLRLYVDGVLIATNYNTPDIYYNTTNYSSVCGYISSSVLTRPLENGGRVDGVGIWNRELTQAEVTELYNSGNGKQYPN